MELFLRIEQLLGHKIPVYEPNKDSVMVMMERVTEAQRIAKLVRNVLLSFTCCSISCLTLQHLNFRRKCKLTVVYNMLDSVKLSVI